MDFQRRVSTVWFTGRMDKTISFSFLFFYFIECTSCSLWSMGCPSSCHRACGILVLQPRIKPASPALEGRFLTTRPAGMEKAMATHSSTLAWWAAVYGVAQNWTWLKWLSSSSSRPAGKSWQNNFLIFPPSKQWEIHYLKRETCYLSTIICYSAIQ